MLTQLIYTRCMPHRDLKNKGQVVRTDGFGVFSMSQGLISDPPVLSYDFLQTRLAVQNGAKENSDVGLFNSYEYTALESDIYALSYEVARPHCKESRKNGQGHRTGTYIKQCFVGSVKDYPFMWFGASAWDAYQKSENEYYLDEDPGAVPEFLPLVKDSPNGGYITVDKVKAFVNDGRIEAVKAGIWFLVQEYSKPDNERKVLLIKDTPENVELWIAAIEYAFSPEMARTVTFSTNKTRLGTQIDNVLFYYTDESGKFYPMLNRSTQQIRHPYNMIVGFHPKDTFCSGVKPMPVSNFVMIDGTTKTASFAPDGTIKAAYYSAAVQYGDDIMDFCGVVLPSLPVDGITNKIPELYDAYKYLLDSNNKVEKWNYRDAVTALRSFTQYGIPQNDVLNKYILDEGLRGYQKFAVDDERNGFALLKILWKISSIVKRNREVTGCLADRLSSGMVNLRSADDSLTSTWNAIKAAGVQNIVQPALNELFNDGELASYSSQFNGAPASSICTLLNLYYETFSREKMGINAILESEDRYSFVCSGLIFLINDGNALRSALNGISSSTDLVNKVALTVSQCLEQHAPEKTEDWWNEIINLGGGDVIEWCRTLCKSPKTNIDMIEHLLVNQIHKLNRCDRESIRAFDDSMKLLGKNKNTGTDFYKAWIKVAEPSQAGDIIRSIREAALAPSVEKELFKILDNFIPYSASSAMMSAVLKSMKEWSNDIGEVSVCVAFDELRRNLKHVQKQEPERAAKVLYEFSKLKIALPNGFTYEEYFKNIASSVAGFCDGEVHMAFLSLFDIQDDRDKRLYVKTYVEEVLGCARGKQIAYSMLSLCEASITEFKIPGKKAAQVKELSNMLYHCFNNVLPNYYKSSLADQVLKINDYGIEVKGQLFKMLKNAGQKVGPKGVFSGLLENIFGKK